MDLEEIFNFGGTDEKYRVLPWHKRVWYGKIKPSLALPVPCKIYLRDWRLGLGRMCLQLCIAMYAFVSVLSSHSYLLLEPVQVLTQFKIFHPDMANLHQKEYMETVFNRTDNFCSRAPLFNFMFSPGDPTKPSEPIVVSGCKTVQASDTYRTESSRSVMLHTVLSETLIDRLSVAVDPDTGNVTDCPDRLAAAAMPCGPDKHGTGGVVRYSPYSPITQLMVNTEVMHPNNEPLPPRANNGTCACMHTNHFFALGVEDMEVQIEHLWQTTFAHGALPETRVRKYDGIEYKAIFQAGTPPRATLREWLEWMEVDLDVPINQGKNTQWVQTTDEYKSALLGPEGVDRFDFPRPRLTGLRVKVTMEYYNHFAVPGGSKIGLFMSPNPTPVCVLTLTPTPIWTSTLQLSNTAGNYPYTYLEMQTLQYTGIQMMIETRGMIGKFTFGQLSATLVSALVLLGSADVVLILCARFAFGEKSRVYDDMVYEKVKLVFNFARFATRSLIGSMVFDSIDEDRGGKMGKEELFEVLHKVLFLQNVSPKHTGSLVEFVYDVIEKNMESEDEVEEAERANRVKTGEDHGEIDMEIARVEGVTPVITREIRIDGKMHKVRADAKVTIDDEETLNLEDWINIFHGPPCDVDAMVELVQENNRRGKYIPPKEETPEGKTYANANQKVLTLMEKERRNPRSRANLKREEEVANKLMNTVMFVGRDLESMSGDMRAHREEVKQSVAAARRLKDQALKRD